MRPELEIVSLNRTVTLVLEYLVKNTTENDLLTYRVTEAAPCGLDISDAGRRPLDIRARSYGRVTALRVRLLRSICPSYR